MEGPEGSGFRFGWRRFDVVRHDGLSSSNDSRRWWHKNTSHLWL